MEKEKITLSALKKLPNLQEENPYIKRLDKNTILKLLKPFYQSHPEYQIEQKYEYSEELKEIEGLVLPKAKVVSENNQVVGAIYDYIDAPSLKEMDDSKNLDLNYYSKRYQKLQKRLQACSEKGVIITDLNTLSNILYKQDQYYFIDYEDMQIKDCPTPIMSSFISKKILKMPKYYQEPFFTNDFAKLSLASLFFLDVFELNLTNIWKLLQLRPDKARELLQKMGILDFKELQTLLLNVISKQTPNPWLDEVLTALKNYHLTYCEDAQIRKIVYQKD